MNDLGGVRFGTQIAAAARDEGLVPKLSAASASPGVADSGPHSPGQLGGLSGDQLLADNREALGRVNALAAYSGLAPQSTPLAGMPQSPYATAAMPGSAMAPTPFTPARSWTSLSPQGGSDPDGSGANADQGMADLVDGGDVLDSKGDA